jgi:hypothetical protein
MPGQKGIGEIAQLFSKEKEKKNEKTSNEKREKKGG